MPRGLLQFVNQDVSPRPHSLCFVIQLIFKSVRLRTVLELLPITNSIFSLSLSAQCTWFCSDKNWYLFSSKRFKIEISIFCVVIKLYNILKSTVCYNLN